MIGKKHSDIQSVQEAVKLIDERHNFFELDNPEKLAYQKSVARAIKGFLSKPEFLIREVIQNADDAKSEEITIKVFGYGVEIQNDGEEFTKDQFIALSAIGESTKKLGEFIGNFGIGFKSVFYYTDEVKLASGYLKWVYKSDTICVPFRDHDCIDDVEYTVGTKISFELKEDRKDIFLEELKNFPKETILFLRNIKKIRIIIDDKCEEISKEFLGGDKWNVIVSKDGSEVERYHFILKKDYIKLDREHSTRFLRHKLRERYEETSKDYPEEIELSISVSILIKNEYEIDDEYNGLFYTFLPTQSKTYLPCNIHADFVIEQDRRFIDQTNEFNRLFIEKAIGLIKRVIEYYKNANSDSERLQVYKWLKKAEFDREKEPLIAYLHSAIREMFENDALILIDYSLYKDVNEVFFRKEEVVNADEWLFNYLDKKKTYKYIRRRYKRYQAHPEVVKILKEHNIEIEEFTFEDILKDLEHNPSLPTEPEKLLRFYQAIKDYWMSKPKNDEEVKTLIANANFLLLEEKAFTSISLVEEIYYVKSKIPEKYLKYAIKYIDLLDRELTEEIKQAGDAEEILKFLEEIGVKELTLRTIQDVLVEEINKNPENWRSLFAELINLQKENPRKLDKLKFPCYKLSTPNKVEWFRPNEIYFSKAFKEILGYDLEVILRFSEDSKFVLPDFLEDDFLELIEGDSVEDKKEMIFRFLERQGVKQRLDVKDDEDNIIKLPKSQNINPVEKAKEELKEFIEENNIDFSIEFFIGVPLKPYNSNIYPNKISGYVFGIIDREMEHQDKIIKELRRKDRDYVINFSNMILRNWQELGRTDDLVSMFFRDRQDYKQEYKQFLKLRLLYSYKIGTYSVGEQLFGLSKFGKMLKEECWLLDANGEPRSPLELFVNTDDNRKLGLPVVNQNLPLPPDLIEFLELNRSPDIEYLLKRLEVAINRRDREEIEDILWKIYLEVSKNEKSKNKIKEKLKKIPIWKDTQVELVPVERVCWTSQIREEGFSKKQQRETILKMITPLKDYYGERFRDFFVKVLGIPEIIPPKIFIDYYTKLLEKTEPLSDAEVAFVLNVYLNADSYEVRNEILNTDKLLNLNHRFVLKSDIEFYCLNGDIATNLLLEIKEKTLRTPGRLRDRNIKGSVYEVLLKELTDIEEISTYKCIPVGEEDYDIDFKKESLVFAIWNYRSKLDIDTDKIKDLCSRILGIKVKKAKKIKMVYEVDGEKITSGVEITAAYDESRNTIYIKDEKARNEYSALFQIKDALSKYLSTFKDFDEVFSNCFDRPIEYVKEFLLSKGIEKVEEPPFDLEEGAPTVSTEELTEDTSISGQISETPAEVVEMTPSPSESAEYSVETQEEVENVLKSHIDDVKAIYGTEGSSEHVEEQTLEVALRGGEKERQKRPAEGARPSEKEGIQIVEPSEQKSELIESTVEDTWEADKSDESVKLSVLLEVEEKSREVWKPECEPSEVDVSSIPVTYIKPTEEFDESPKGDVKLIEFLSTKHESRDAIEQPSSKRYGALSEENRKKVGRMGEELVFLHLKEDLLKKYEDAEIEELDDGGKIVLKRHGQILAEIHWLNHKEDAMKEYDIKLVREGKEKYIEVKSTIKDNKDFFEISLNQWKFAASQGSSYYIYVVHKVGTKEPKFFALENPHELWKQGKLEVRVDSMRMYI